MIWVYALLNALTLGWGFRYARQVGLRQVIPFVVCLALLLIYCLITPMAFYVSDRETVTGDSGAFQFVGKSIRAYYEPGMLAYLLANFCFVTGFTCKKLPLVEKEPGLDAASLASIRRVTVGLYALFMMIVLGDIAVSGINVLDVLLGQSTDSLMTSKSVTNTYYFRAFADSIITTLVVYAYLNAKPLRLLALLVPAFILFALLGFRYRIILTLLGLVLVFGMNQRVPGTVWRWGGLGLALLYVVLTITYNRWFFITGAYDRITVNPTEYDYSLFLDQTRGSLADFNLLRYYAENPETPHDYGLSMFGYVFIRIIPKQFFPSGEKPYPSPYLDVLDRSLELPRTWVRIGEANLHYGAFYAGFGWLGFLILPFLLGLWINYVVYRNPADTSIGFLTQIIFSLGLFQLITRGYFPQFIDHLVYLFIPLWLIGGRLRQTGRVSSLLNPSVHEAVY
ncbi:O-antigen polymerase [Spirosoma fluminis]